MNRSLSVWKVRGFIFTAVFGVLLHFLYEWTNNNGVIALFSAVNESTWEHMKLLFFPMFVFSLIIKRYQSYDNFWWSALLGITFGTVLIPVLFYTISGVFGKTPDWINILIFFVSVFFAYVVEFKTAKKGNDGFFTERQSLVLLCLLAILFAVFTYFTPQIPLFADPISGEYGI